MKLMEVLIMSCEARNWTKHNDFQKKSIFGYNFWSPFMRLYFQLLSRGKLVCHFLFLLIMEFLLVILLHICNVFQVRSVVLHTLNRARFNVAVETFLKTGALSVI